MGDLWLSSSLKPYLRNLLDIRSSCRAENVNWDDVCTLTFSPDGGLFSIGNVTRGTLPPDPDIAGQGVSSTPSSRYAVSD